MSGASGSPAWALTPSAFADLPLHDFLDQRRANGTSFMLREGRDSLSRGDCLALVAANRLLTRVPCGGADSARWVYDSTTMAFHPAQDTSLCLDIFSFSSLGVYWCHGGPNQLFRSSEREVHCSPYDERFCVSVVSGRSGEDARRRGEEGPKDELR